MKILIVNNSVIPAQLYGGTERVIWYLGKELKALHHEVTYLVAKGSACPFAKVLTINPTLAIVDQIPCDIDVVHFNFTPPHLDRIKMPYLITMHGNMNEQKSMDLNTVFVSKNHASRYGSTCYVHNGLDWNDYSKPDLNMTRNTFHFLGNAAWRVKNVQGAIDTILKTKKETLSVLGGTRINFKMGFRITLSPRIKFYGMVGGSQKDDVLNQSKGLLFPVKWHEPFGLSIIESLYFGCPIFATPYGSLPEIVTQETGFLSANANDLAQALMHASSYSKRICHEYALTIFNAKNMALSYIHLYEKMLLGEKLNKTNPILQELPNSKYLDWIE